MDSVKVITNDLEKPELDNRLYRVIQLPNKLEALLVHDSETDKASASLSVNVGNFSDDEDMPGMAHAVEHLLFMGTEKYPVENEYSSYLSKNSGYSNAYTSATLTNYYFECAASNEPTSREPNEPPSHGSNGPPSGDANGIAPFCDAATTNGVDSCGPLHGALDRFAQFFVKPLFLENTLDRELQAVDSENKKNLQSDQWRLSQLAKSLSSKDHPYHHFSTGNLQTLRDEPQARGINIRDAFIEFYGRHYSANRMKLVVMGKEPLDTLQQWTTDLFSDIKNKDLPQNRWDETQPLTAEHINTQIFAKPVMQSRSIEISFPYQDEDNMYETQPSRYISHLIGHEGPGSILVYLKEKGLANSLSCGANTICPGSAFLEINISLTAEGLKNYTEVVKIVFQYIGMIKENPPVDWMFDEMKNIAEVDFRFRQKSPPSRFAMSTSATMQKPYPREWLLSGISKFRRFDPKAIVNAMQFLREDNFRLMIISQDAPVEFDQKEKWYGTEYKVEKIPTNVRSELRKALEASSNLRSPGLHLPHKNEFIPTALDVEKIDVKEPAKAPKLLRNDDIARLWWKKDDTFWVPKAYLSIALRSPLTYSSPGNYVKAVLFFSLVKDALNAYSYDADISGLGYSLDPSVKGIDLWVHGYNDKMAILLEKILITMKDLEIQNDRFEIIKEKLARDYKNFGYGQPYLQMSSYTRWLIDEKVWMISQYAEELPHISVEDVRAFAPRLLSQLHVEILVHGNMYKEDAKKIASLFESILKPRPLPEAQWPTRRNILLPEGSNFIYKHTLTDPENINNAIEYYLHVGDVMDVPLRAKLHLFAQMTSEPAFNQLRTKEQLGYVVWSGNRPSASTMGYRVLIQSERDGDYLEARVDLFLRNFRTELEEMSENAFEGHKQSLIKKRLEKLKNLESETNRLWTYISSEHLNFYQVDRDAEAIGKLTKEEMQAFYDRFIDPGSKTRAKVSVHLVAQKKVSAANGDGAIGGVSSQKKDQLFTILTQFLQANGIASADTSSLSSHFKKEKVDFTSQSSLSSAVASFATSQNAEADVQGITKQLNEALPQLMLALQLSVPPAGEVTENIVPATEPILIKDVCKWKASMRLSQNTMPVADIHDFEDLESKL